MRCPIFVSGALKQRETGVEHFAAATPVHVMSQRVPKCPRIGGGGGLSRKNDRPERDKRKKHFHLSFLSYIFI